MHLKYNLWTTYKNCHSLHINEFADPRIMTCFLLFRNANLRLTSLTLWCLRSPESPISVTEDPPPLQVVILQRLRTKNPHPRPLAQDPLFTLPLSRAPVQTPPVRRRAGGLRTCPWTRALYVGTPRRATPPAATRPAHPASQFPPRPPCPFPPVPSPQPPLPPPLPPAAATAFLLPRLLQPAVMAMAAKSPRSPRSTKIKRGSEKESKRGIRIRTERGIESITGRITAIRKHSPGRNIGMRQNKNTFLPTSATNRTEKVCFAMSYAFCGVNIYWIIDYYK